MEPRRVSRVKTMEKLQCQGKGFGFDYPVRDPSDALELGCDWNRTELLEFHHF